MKDYLNEDLFQWNGRVEHTLWLNQNLAVRLVGEKAGPTKTTRIVIIRTAIPMIIILPVRIKHINPSRKAIENNANYYFKD